MISRLIDKQDTFEIVRDKIATIVKTESVNQQAKALESYPVGAAHVLAFSGGNSLYSGAFSPPKNPSLWALRVFVEASNPWEFFRTSDGHLPADTTPIVNVWYDGSSIDENASQTINRQQYTGTFNIDVYGLGTASVSRSGDTSAAFEVQRAARLVRNIIMAPEYRLLGIAPALGLVGKRTVQNLQTFQPSYGEENAQSVGAMRLTLQVLLSEYVTENVPNILEQLNIIVSDRRGEILVDTSFFIE